MLRKILLIFLLIMSMSGCRQQVQLASQIRISDLQGFHYYNEHYKVDPYLKAAMDLQALGKENAIRQLLDWGHDEPDVYYDQIVILCRMLFITRGESHFPEPSLDTTKFIGGTSEIDWPLYPITMIDGVPFVVMGNYALNGQRLPAYSYVMNCFHFCDWNPYQYKSKTTEQKQAALKKLLASTKWKGELPVEYLKNQIE